jgi:hypothetical protein
MNRSRFPKGGGSSSLMASRVEPERIYNRNISTNKKRHFLAETALFVCLAHRLFARKISEITSISANQ